MNEDLVNQERRRVIAGCALGSLGLALGSPAAVASSCVNEDADPGALQPISIPPQAPAKTGLAKLPGTSLWYWDTGGNGAPIVLLHPSTGSARVWPYQQPVFTQAGYRVIGYSRRGYEHSDAGSKADPGTGAGDLQELLRYLGIERFHAVASAGGAFVAADFALMNPERLYSMVLACTILGVQDDALEAMTRGLQIPDFQQLPAHFRELGPSYRAVDPEGTERWKVLESTSMPGEKFMQPLMNKMSLNSLAQLKLPTLLISGDSDLIAPPPVGRLIASRMPACDLKVLPECGHSAYWERPHLFNRAVLDFLTRTSYTHA